MTHPTSPPDLRTRLRELRKSRGWTLAHVAEALDTTPQTISRLETNVMTVSTDWLQKFADLFGVGAADLIAESPRGAVEIIGHAGADGLVTPTLPTPLPVRLQLENGIAVKLDAALGPYRAGSYVVAARLEGRNLAAALGQTCIIAVEQDTIWIAKVIEGLEGRYTLVPLEGGQVHYDQTVAWAARIKMEIRLSD